RRCGGARVVGGSLRGFPLRGAGAPPGPRVRLERGARGRPAGEPARDPRSLLSPPADGTETLVGPAGPRHVPAPRERMGNAPRSDGRALRAVRISGASARRRRAAGRDLAVFQPGPQALLPSAGGAGGQPIPRAPPARP